MALIERALTPSLREVLDDTRVAAILGPRQAGKSTLARTLLDGDRFRSYVTLDDQAVRDEAVADPDGFVAALRRPAIIDEIQRAPNLMLAIKIVVDEDPRPGQFLITGSANLLTQRGVADALPGRAEYLRLWPLAQSELTGSATTLIDRLFAVDPPLLYDQSPGLVAYADTIARGGFPDAHQRTAARRQGYFQSYVETLLGRDLRDVAAPQLQTESVPRLLRLLAARSSELANFDSLARDLQYNPKTARDHTALLEQLFLVHRLRPWSGNLSQREVKSPKLFLTDSGMLCALIGATSERLVRDGALGGRATETFAVNELLRQAGWCEQFLSGLWFYRDRDGREVDVVIETTDGRVVGVEIKAAASIGSSDTLGLRFLRERLGERFVAGAVLYTGRTTLPLGDRLWALPLSALWS
ncbi:MAG TPA: ATP-binding protein [Conexibacter sp.]|nr:ATP-binding protein [Conexibacter sp.]